MTFIVRPYAGESDLPAITDFLNHCETVDRFGNYYTVTELHLELTEPGWDPVENVQVWESPNQQIVAFAQLWFPTVAAVPNEVEGYLWFRVHPTIREQGLESEILIWGETRIRKIAEQQSLPAQLRTDCQDTQANLIHLLRTRGFQQQRCFIRMERSLLDPIAEPKLPTGFTVIQSQREHDRVDRVTLFNESFVDHWNYHPWTVEEAAHWEQDPNYQPELELIAVAPDGTYTAFCRCCIEVENNTHHGEQKGWVQTLGTRRDCRRQGLGRAMLLHGLHQLQSAGMELAALGVDAENPNQAFKLYESMGFQKRHASFIYAKSVQA